VVELLLFTVRFEGGRIKDDHMGRTFSKHGRGVRVVHGFQLFTVLIRKMSLITRIKVQLTRHNLR
jgi:hypothetical protein